MFIACSYTFIFNKFIIRFVHNQLNTEYQSLLNQTINTTQDLLWELTLTSQQLVGNEQLQKLLMDWQDTTDRREKLNIYNEIFVQVSSLTMFNSDIGIVYLYDPIEDDYIYNTLPVNNKKDSYPALYQNASFSFIGPTKSQSNYNNNPVLILNRTELLPNKRPLMISVESNYNSLNNLIQTAKNKSVFLIFLNDENIPLYHTLPDNIDPQQILNSSKDVLGQTFYSFSIQNSQGWSVLFAVPDSVYADAYNTALRDFIICTILIFIVMGIITLYFWRIIYRPLKIFDKNLNKLLSQDMIIEDVYCSIPEYRQLLGKISSLQKQIQEMMQNVINQEKLHSKMQLEKLRALINPHFLLNSLNTLHWMALLNDQPEIDEITQSLSHLLSYNLNRQDQSTRLEDELNTLKEYITLQKVRYDFSFEVCMPENTDLNYSCPKFILQPFIENALSHGYQEGMNIILRIHIDEWIIIEIQDTGSGMDNGTLQKLKNLAPINSHSLVNSTKEISPDNIHFGIGLQYVISSLHDYYKGNYDFTIESYLGHGTLFVLKIPKLTGGETHVEDIDHR